MEYEIEELVPIVGQLAEKYTAHESSSITYEKAEQLMGAVLYCIHELEQLEENTLITMKMMPAEKAYQNGKKCVEEKVKKSLSIYNDTLSEFSHYQNKPLYETFVQGLPEFFRWYDIEFEPQNTILTLDYPVLKDISMYTGIDKVYEYITCIRLEQTFLSMFSKAYIQNTLLKYDSCYTEMIDNICGIVLMSAICHVLAGKQITEISLDEDDYLHIQEIFRKSEQKQVNMQLRSITEKITKKYYKDNRELLEYLSHSIKDISVRLKNASENDALINLILK